jgi:hypothetical protein
MGPDNFPVELAKWGLVSNVNFFSRVDADFDRRISFDANNSTLRITSNCVRRRMPAIPNTDPAPLKPNPKYQPKLVQLAIRTVAAADDSCRIL